MNVRMVSILAIYTRIVQIQMEVTLVLALMVITVMETFVLVNIFLLFKIYFRLYDKIFIWSLVYISYRCK